MHQLDESWGCKFSTKQKSKLQRLHTLYNSYEFQDYAKPNSRLFRVRYIIGKQCKARE